MGAALSEHWATIKEAEREERRKEAREAERALLKAKLLVRVAELDAAEARNEASPKGKKRPRAESTPKEERLCRAITQHSTRCCARVEPGKRVCGKHRNQSGSKSPVLVIEKGAPREIITLEWDRTYTIGRDPSCRVVLPASDLTASAKHAKIKWFGSTYGIKNKSNTNGTQMNGSNLDNSNWYKLKDGAIISMGGVRMRYVT